MTGFFKWMFAMDERVRDSHAREFGPINWPDDCEIPRHFELRRDRLANIFTTSVHRVDRGFVVADHGVWCPGVYATDETARRAVKFTDSQLRSLDFIYRVDQGNRPVTDDDLDRLENSLK